MAEATQVEHPWRATLRTLFAAAIGVAAVWGLVVEAAGVDQTNAVVVASLAVTGAITRIMALPQVDALLKRFLPWLATGPQE